MKLVFDENLSPRLTAKLVDSFSGSTHVDLCELGSAPDESIWEFAKDNEFTIVSKDTDFHDRNALYGSPPKVIWPRAVNCSTAEIEAVLRRSADDSLIIFRSSLEAG